MRSVVLSVAAAAILFATPVFARSNQSAPPAGGQSGNGGTTSGKSGNGASGMGLSNSSLFGVGIAAAATLGIVLATRDSSPPASP